MNTISPAQRLARCALLAVLVLFTGCRHEPPPPQPLTTLPDVTAGAPEIVKPPWSNLTPPTTQTHLLDAGAAGVFMPTAPQHPESALFGSVRTNARGAAQFHEGLDIAPLRRDRRGEALDEVRAAAAGVIGYVNRVGGNSTYGQYVVVLHRDPLGAVYTLYAHLAAAAAGLQPGQPVRTGQPLGRMGHTSSTSIPRDRAHLHFEIGLLNNARFALWYRAQKLKPDHGSFHGGNLLGVDPLAVFRLQRQQPAFGFRDFLAQQPAAFEVVLPTARPLNFFQRYPALWEGERPREPQPAGLVLVLSCTENGLPLKGRAATEAERRALGRGASAVLRVNAAALGRNGSHLLVQGRGGWKLAAGGERWLSALVY
ncbi:MAG: M23 family metallopeptidase [Kiritimatiellaeota bacterium]|nr:M23 family metallopeptidase [Kiritimatiellota bacterium]